MLGMCNQSFQTKLTQTLLLVGEGGHVKTTRIFICTLVNAKGIDYTHLYPSVHQVLKPIE